MELPDILQNPTMRIHQSYYFGILIELTLAASSHTLSSLQLPSTTDHNHTFSGLLLPNSSNTKPSLLSLLLPNAATVNTTLLSLQLAGCAATNDTLSISSSRPSLLPLDPYSYEVPNSLVTVTTYSYVAAIPEACARLCISKANRYMLLNVRNFEEPIRQHLKYSSLSIDLTLNPWSTMTWDMWRATLKGLEHFVSAYQAVGLDFDIVIRDPKGAGEWMTGVGRMGSL